MNAFSRMIIVEPDPGAIGEPGWWLWEVSAPDPTRPMGRRVLMESSSRWRWLALARALYFAWLGRNDRLGDRYGLPAEEGTQHEQ